YSLECGYINYENYIIVFRDKYKDNPYKYKIHNYFLYKVEMLKEVVIKVPPLTTRGGVLYINKGGI
ncbi:hypothetical protein V8E51_002789, partial [Hyaloscypha variabilis]